MTTPAITPPVNTPPLAPPSAKWLVQAPDGKVIQFPDEFQQSDVEREMNKMYPAQGSGTYQGPLTSTGIAAPQGTSTAGEAWKSIKQTANDLATGASQGAANTVGSSVVGTAKLLNKIPLIGKYLAPPEGIDALAARTQDRSTPQNTTQAIGKGTEQVGEFLLPGTGEEDAVAHALPYFSKLGRMSKPLARVLYQSGTTGLVNAAQGGSPVTGAATGAIGGAVGEGLRAAAPAVAESALGITKRMRGYGKTPGVAALEETTGLAPHTIEKQAQQKLGQLTDQIEGMADTQSGYAPRQRPVAALPAAPVDIPLASVEEGEMPGRLVNASRPPIPDSAFSPESRIARGDSGLSPVRLTDADSPDAPYRYYTTSGDTEVPNAPQSEAGVLRTRDPKIINQVQPPPSSPYRLPPLQPRTPVSLHPALGVIDDEIAKATAQNNAGALEQLGRVRKALTESASTGDAIPATQTPRGALDLKRGLRNQFVKNWNPELMSGTRSVAARASGAIDSELDNALGPEFESANQRISSLAPVAERSESLSRDPGIAQRVGTRIAAHTGALAGSALGGAEGYRQDGLKGAIVGGTAGAVLPELLATPSIQMWAARRLYKPSLILNLLKGSGLQLDRDSNQQPDQPNN